MIEVDSSYDINHVQLIDEDRKAIISSRMTNAIIKVDVEKAETDWVCGGEYGDYKVVSIDGTEHSAGASLWAGQRACTAFFTLSHARNLTLCSPCACWAFLSLAWDRQRRVHRRIFR